MKKHEFLQELLRRLSQLPSEERDKAYTFYAEIIDDSMEDGISEEEAVQKLGSIDEIVERIAAETPMVSLIRARAGRKPRSRGRITLLVLGFPVWFPVLLSVACVVLTLFLVAWTLVLVLWVVLAALAAAIIGGLAWLFLYAELGVRLLGLGGAMACAGSAILLYPACVWVTKQFARLTRQLWTKGKSALMNKGETPYETIS
ncbi:MAG TPA: DUF1700 domain-containing protein [Candidatus Limiplasma sp.]|nr:DUF1700 domain-containing protein [Candidatus Limiplasma sp.]HRX07895.1 DUF1700 domain-containing protein [Candidatus Limiplasma sp.]